MNKGDHLSPADALFIQIEWALRTYLHASGHTDERQPEFPVYPDPPESETWRAKREAWEGLDESGRRHFIRKQLADRKTG